MKKTPNVEQGHQAKMDWLYLEEDDFLSGHPHPQLPDIWEDEE